MEFKQFWKIHEMASVGLTHQAKLDGMGMPCHGKIPVTHIDIRAEDYGMANVYSNFADFWGKFPADPVYLVYHGSGKNAPKQLVGKGEILNAEQAAPYIEKYKQLPSDWWKYAQALGPDYTAVKEPLKIRDDGEKLNPNICGNNNAIPIHAPAMATAGT
jgi:hypothetical protein